MALRTVQQAADQKGKPVFLHFEEPKPENIKKGFLNFDLNKIMQNIGGEAFVYGTFSSAFESDPRIKNMVKNFNQDGAELKSQSDVEDPGSGGDEGSDTVSKMAKNATDLSDL